ncbi:MAG: hypothetical protein P8N76_17275 [Pirellulaceae bacterium]|nr:hypothetical protein [Pirellulaceae bacterium]
MLTPCERLAIRQDGFRPNDGGLVTLKTADGQEFFDAHRVADRIVGRSARHDGRWLYASEPTPGTENLFQWQDDIVINEIMFHAADTPTNHSLPETVERHSVLDFDRDQWLYNQSGDGLEAGWWDTRYIPDGEKWFQRQGLIGFDTTPLAMFINTELNNPRDTAPQVVTYYFQTAFEMTVDQLREGNEFELLHFIESGAAFYLNDQEFHRFNLSQDADSQTLALPSVNNAIANGPYKIPTERFNDVTEESLQIRLRAAPIEPTGKTVLSAEQLNAGDRVIVNWKESWWRGKALEVFANDMVKVHYIGWSDNWDEVVQVARIQLPAEGN